MRFIRLVLPLFALFITACGGGSSDPEAMDKPADDPNTVLAITSSSTFSVSENSTVIGTLTASKAVTWHLSGTDGALIAVNYTWGYLTFKAAPDFETAIDDGKNNTYVFTVTARDGAVGATETVTQEITVTITDDETERGSIVSDSTYTPFIRYLDVKKLRLFARSGVSNTFMESVASTYEAMLMNTTSIDYDLRGGFLAAADMLNVYQRIGYIGPENYSGELAPLPGGIAGYDNATDYVWELVGKTEADVIGEVMEHLLHTITEVVFSATFSSDWAWKSTSSKVHLAMQQAISNGIYDISDYAGLLGDAEAHRKVITKEYGYWLILAEWDYFGITGKVDSGYGTGNSEFTKGTAAEIAASNPLGHTLYLDTVAKVLSVPDKDVIRSLY